MNTIAPNTLVTRIILGVIALLLVALLVRPYFERAIAPPQSTPRPITARGDLSPLEKTSVDIFQTVSPSVAQVVVTRRNPLADIFGGRQIGGGAGGGENRETGSGFVWDNEGHIVTNAHVVGASGGSIVVRLASGDVVPATLVGRSTNYDLAVLKLNRSVSLPPPIPLGTVNDLKVGQLAYAIGNPFGFEKSMSMGIISALKRRLPTSGGREIPDVIQSDALINPGNSGGPLLDSAGRVIGVTTAMFSPNGGNTGIGLAIPVDVVNRVVPQLISEGRVPTPGIGILAADERLTAELGVKGVAILGVVPDSPAAQAGITGIREGNGRGDIITAVNGKPIKQLTDFTDQLEATGVGKTIELTLDRDDRTINVSVPVVDIGESQTTPTLQSD